MASYDLALFHAPSVYDFRKAFMFKSVISEVIPSFSVFDMYPYGFLTLTTWLTRKGYKVGLFNIAAKMMLDRDYDPLKTIREVDAKVYGIDLHWLVHAHGAIEVAKLIKREHPDSLVIFGGISSTYYWRELLDYKFIDAVVLGDTTEPVVEKLLKSVETGKEPNFRGLAYKWDGRIKFTGLPEPVTSLDQFKIDHGLLVKLAIKERDLCLVSPYSAFIEAPISAVITIKGCPFSCVTCGGSFHSYMNIFGRKRLAVKGNDAILEEVLSIASLSKMTIFFVGDLRLGRGLEGAIRLLKELKRYDLENPLMFEFFAPPPKELLKAMREAASTVYLQISPESQDENVRRAFGRPYGNDSLERFVRNSSEMGFDRLDLYFMVGLPYQTPQVVHNLHKYVERLFNQYDRLDAFVSPLAPFVDPGSLAFENPQAFGYKLLFKDLESHRRALTEKHWGFTLNYETYWMNRGDIVRATMKEYLNMGRVKLENGIISQEMYQLMKEKVDIDLSLYNALSKGMKINEDEIVDKLRDLDERREVLLKKELYPCDSLINTLKVPRPIKAILGVLARF